MKKFYGRAAYVQSAGVKNDMEIDGFAVAVCQEIGVELSTHRSRSFEEMHDWGDDLGSFDLIVALSPASQRMALELTRVAHLDVEYWPIMDPAGLAEAVDRGSAAPALYRVLELAGAAYLAWLAWKSCKKALAPPQVRVTGIEQRQPLARLFLIGLGLQLTNLKALVFWMAAVSAGPAQGAPLAVLLVFALGGMLLSLAGHGFYAVILSSRPVRHAYNRARRWIEGALGIFLGAMALRMATEHR